METAISGLPARGGRLIQLDLLRGLAILLVLFRHSIVPWSYAGIARPLSVHLYYLGWTGVDLFFVLSGFLIGGLLFNEIRTRGRLDVRRFLLRRGLKIWPAYFVLIAFVFVRLLSFQHAGFWGALRAVAPNLLHLQNYLGSPRGITWSLAVEEHFYLALPLLLLLVTSRWRRTDAIPAIPIVAVLLVVGCTAFRVVFHWHPSFDMWRDLAPTHLRIDGLFFGVTLAYFYHFKPELLAGMARHRAALLIVGTVLVLPLGVWELGAHPFAWTIGYTMLYVGYGCILVALVHTPVGQGAVGRLMASRPAAALAWVGTFSYSIYLWQFDLAYDPVERYVLRRLPHHPVSLYWALAEMAYLCAAIAAGFVMAKLIEIPVLTARDRLFPSRATSAVARADASRTEPKAQLREPAGVL